MRTVVKNLLVIATVVGLAMAFTPALSWGQQLNIAGATTLKPPLEEASKDFIKTHPDVKFVIGVGGSARGIELAGKGEVQIGTSCRDPNDKEKAAYPGLVVTKLGVDANGVIVHGTNPVQKITAQQVRDIYTGKITNWKDLGGNDAPIVVLSVHPKHSSFEVFSNYFKLDGKCESNVANFKDKSASDYASLGVPTVDATSELTASMLTKPNSIGFCSVGAVLSLAAKGAPLKLLDLEGVPATEATILDGTYPLPRPLLLLTKGEPTGAVKDFIDYMKGDAGKTLLKNKGFFTSK